MKILHAADIHLDSPLVGLQRYEGAPADDLRLATRQALANLVSVAIEEQVALVLLAGDVYDGDWKDYSTGFYFLNQMTRLGDAAIPVVWVAGNHDAVSNITKSLRLPEGVRLLSHKHAETVVFDDLNIAVHGQSFSARAVPDDLAASYPKRAGGLFNIGLLHTSLTGREGHEPYAPCSLDTLRAKGYAYWALGHVHAREVLCRDPWMVFAGNIQGRNIRECGRKGCTLVTVDEGAVVHVEHRELDVLRWHLLDVDATEAATGHDVVDRVAAAIGEAHRANDGMPMAVRVQVSGECRAHRALLSNPEHWAAEIRACANETGAGTVWVEKVKMATRAVRDTAHIAADFDGPLRVLVSALDELTPESEAVLDLKADLKDLANKLPPELRERGEFPDLARAADVAALAECAKQLLLARMLDPEDEA